MHAGDQRPHAVHAKAENRHPWAQTCDTTSCQVYGGRAVQDGGGYQDLYGAGVYATTSDVAVSSTGGLTSQTWSYGAGSGWDATRRRP